jgi:PAS domain S-box-containing protein
MLWLYLLGAVTGLSIALRRVLRRQKPLNDELYSTKVAVNHVQSGVAWVRADGKIGSINAALATTLSAKLSDIAGREWTDMFPVDERDRLLDAYCQMLLTGMTSVDAYGLRADGSFAWLNVRLVTMHDRRMRFVGHQCLILDRTQERLLEEQLRKFTKPLAICA